MNLPSIVVAALLAGTAFGAATLHAGGIDTYLQFIGLLAGTVLAGYGLRSAGNNLAGQRALPVGLTNTTLLLLSIWLLASPAFSFLPGTSFIVGWLMAAMPLTYFATVVALRDDSVWRSSLWLIQIIALLIMALGLVDFLLIRSRPFSVFQDVNALAAFCNVFALPAIARLHERIRANGWRMAACSGTAGFLLVALACLAATASRGGHLSFLFGIVVLSTLLIRHDRQAWRTLAASLVLFVALLAVIAPFQNHAGSLSRLAGINGDQSTADRLAMLKSTWAMVKDGPWYGSGLGTYKVRYLMFRSSDEHSSSGDLAHNDYLQIFAEGGPLLLGLLLLLAFSVALAACRLWHVARYDGDSPSFVEAAGLVGALCCLFSHAALNFIFYVMPLALIAGLYFGRLDLLRTDARSFDLFRVVSRPMLITLLTGLGLWLTATIGLQSAYYAMTTGKCSLRMCAALAGDEKFYGKFSALMAATQPSYLPAREWFVNAYTGSANVAVDDTKRIEAARKAAKELSDQIRQYPALPYVWRELGSLILRHPEAATVVAADIPRDPTALFAESLRRNPLDADARVKLAQRLDADGKSEAAFSLLFDDGMRWWKVAAFPDSGRSMLLKAAIPLALKLGRCKDAIEMAQGLNIFLPDDPLAKPIAHLGEREPPVSDGTPGCAAG
ncbi:O-antigen ligase family protein [Nevskia ramosa]|uniref:O-antigen ligase family protein n=1 Tax=Nevskia ramosa TaxID=64002 RepID=UPI003D135064